MFEFQTDYGQFEAQFVEKNSFYLLCRDSSFGFGLKTKICVSLWIHKVNDNGYLLENIAMFTSTGEEDSSLPNSSKTRMAKHVFQQFLEKTQQLDIDLLWAEKTMPKKVKELEKLTEQAEIIKNQLESIRKDITTKRSEIDFWKQALKKG